MTEDIFVQDLRANNDASLGPVPRNMVDTYEKLSALFGLSVIRQFGWDIAPPGSRCYKLVGFYLRTGVSEYIVKVRDITGAPLENIVVLRSWGEPGEPGSAETPAQPGRPPYFRNFVGGWTNAEGDAGFPYENGSVVRDGIGPDRIWPTIDPEGRAVQYSDCAINLGWWGSTNHLTPNPIFQIVEKSNVTPPPTPGGEKRIVIVDADGTAFGSLTLSDGIGPSGIKKLVVMDGITPVGFAAIQEAG
jgi:hypothetical protein